MCDLGFSMICNEQTEDRLKIIICCNSKDSACFGHNYHHINIRPMSNWFVGVSTDHNKPNWEGEVVRGRNMYA